MDMTEEEQRTANSGFAPGDSVIYPNGTSEPLLFDIIGSNVVNGRAH